jgi:Kef-type K+ transport system membrane component KefB
MIEAVLFFAILLLSARILEELMLRLKLSQVLGDVLAGLIVGPAFLNLVTPVDEIRFLIDLGLFFFFFTIGFQEIDLFTLRRVFRKRLFPAAMTAFVIPLTASFLLLVHFGMSLEVSVLVSGIVGISSLGVVGRVLMDLKMLKNPLGLEIFGFVAIIEFLGLIFVTFFLQLLLVPSETSLFYILQLVVGILLFFLVVGVVSFAVAPRLLTLVRRNMRVKEASFGVIASLVLIVVWFSEFMNVNGAIGALLLGLGLSRLSESPEHVELIQGFRSFSHGIFVPVFFAGTSLFFSFSFLAASSSFMLSFIMIVLVGKFAGAFIGAKSAKLKNASLLGTGGMSKGGVELALLLSIFDLGVIDAAVFSLVLFTVFIMLVVSPLLLRALIRGKGGGEPSSEIEDSIVPLYCRYAYTSLRVGDVMSSPKAKVSSETNIEEFMKHHVKLGYRNYFVVDRRERLVGILKVTDLRTVPSKKHKSTLVKDIMRRDLPAIYPETSVHTAIEILVEKGLKRMPVVPRSNPRKVIGTFDQGDAIKIMFLGKGSRNSDKIQTASDDITPRT